MARRPPRRPPSRPPRGRGRASPPGALAGSALQMLRQANRLMDRGQYAQAYPLLKRLADGAARAAMPLRAARFYLRAARARMEMGNAEEAMGLARQGIQLFCAAGQSERLRGQLSRLIQELEQHRYHDMAVGLRAEMSALLGGGGAQAAPAAEQARLPARCPTCGSPLRADEVTRTESHSAACAYCGAQIVAE